MSPGTRGARERVPAAFGKGRPREALPAWRERAACNPAFVKLSRSAWDAAGPGCRGVGLEAWRLFPSRNSGSQPAGLMAQPVEVWDVFFFPRDKVASESPLRPSKGFAQQYYHGKVPRLPPLWDSSIPASQLRTVLDPRQGKAGFRRYRGNAFEL